MPSHRLRIGQTIYIRPDHGWMQAEGQPCTKPVKIHSLPRTGVFTVETPMGALKVLHVGNEKTTWSRAPSPTKLDNPTYLLHLAQSEGRAVAAELVRVNPEGIARGEQLTTEQYHFLLKQVTDRLRKTNKLPVQPLSGERLAAFEQPFWKILHNAGLI